MAKIKTNRAARVVRHLRLRRHLSGTTARPRVERVPEAARFTYAQVIDDSAGHTIAAARVRANFRRTRFGKTDAAKEVGRLVAGRAKAKGRSDSRVRPRRATNTTDA